MRVTFRDNHLFLLMFWIHERVFLNKTRCSHTFHNYFGVQFADLYKWRYVGTKISRSGYQGNNYFGFNCIKYGTRCMADNRDSCYSVSWPEVSVMSNTSVFFIVGVVHQDTNKAQWENIVPM